jgi:preprotein translocase subunit SecE
LHQRTFAQIEYCFQVFTTMDKLTLYLRESYQELTKEVTWPTVEQLIDSTLVVLAATAILATVIFAMDVINSIVFKMLYGI